jgi:hypothetical protein
MFKPSFHEGQRLLREDCPEFELEDDDAQLMGVLLSILHYRGNPSNYTMNAEELARLSILCDKYDCTGALGPWIPAWFRHAMGVGHPTYELGFLILAAYMFNDPTEFKAISRKAILRLILKFSAEWEKEELCSTLPLCVSVSYKGIQFIVMLLRNPESIARQIQRILDELETELQNVEQYLRHSSRCYDTWQLFCTQCGRELPGNAKKSHPCRNAELPTKYCTSETRVAGYFLALQRAELWPTLGPFATCSISDISLRFARAKRDARHLRSRQLLPTGNRSRLAV